MAETTPITDSPQSAADVPPAFVRQQLFASPFTPSWSLGLLLFVCLFLPGYRGCNSQVVYLSEAFVLDEFSAEEVYQRFLLIWPPIFGLVVFVGTLVLAVRCDPQRARMLWWSFAGLICIHSTLLVVALSVEARNFHVGAAWTRPEAWAACWLLPTLGLPALLWATARYCRDWFSAAMWMQLALALTAAVCVTLVAPSLLLAQEFLIGGQIMIAGSVGLVVSSIIQLLDGYRSLTRKPMESPLRLSLKATMLLMTVGGLACAWVGTCLFIHVN